ncbi:VanW family protein [Massilioclostridium coli]|uniref:VanW family protein n=1 Tax=Massilioclostridium coli TaxID=1870991 RepID=UPI00085C1018|nr:VanW family protein [Massilioclostridium coli]
MNFSIESIKKHKVPVIITGIVIVLLIVGIIIGVVLYKQHLDKILPTNASLHGISLSKLNHEELEDVLQNEINPKLEEQKIQLTFQDKTAEISLKDCGFSYQADQVFAEAKEYDFKENPDGFTPDIHYNDETLTQLITEFKDSSAVAVTPYSYERKGNQLVVRAGAAGSSIEVEKEKEKIITQVKQFVFDPVVAEGIAVTDDTIAINLDQIHQEVCKEAKDATSNVNSSGKMIYNQEEEGVSFNLDTAKQIVTDPSSGEYTIDLTITAPKVTVEQLKQQHDNAACPDLLQSYTTNFTATDKNRNFNIAKAAATLNGAVVAPGEVFSFNGRVGYTDKAHGYKPAGVYTPNGLEDGYGGGVCQVSTTTYVAAVLANMDITRRSNHSYTVGYVPLGWDAAVSDGGQDFCFKNTRDQSIKIVATTTNTSITVSIYGTKSDKDNYKVEMTKNGKITSTTPFGTKYKDRADMPSTYQKTISNGKNGCTVEVTKTVTYNGAVVSTSVIKSTYKPMDKVIERGTGATEPAQTTPTPTPSAPPAESTPPPETSSTPQDVQ